MCTFPCSPLEMSIFKHFSKTYVSGIDVSHFHHSQPDTLKNLVFSFFCYLNMKNQNCGPTNQVGRLGPPQIDFLGHFTLKRSSRAIMEVDILHTTHLPGKLFQSLQKYPRLENKFRSPGGSKLDHKTLQYVRICFGHDKYTLEHFLEIWQLAKN